MIKSYFKKNIKIALLLLLFIFAFPYSLFAVENLAEHLSGRILLQVEGVGQAWYVSPADEKRYSLGRPEEAFDLMKKLSVGISDKDLAKIPVGVSANNYPDTDSDGLYDSLEEAIGLNKYNQDTDSDGYNDKMELTNGHNPLGAGKLPIDEKFTQINQGKIFLQVEKNGEAWYVEPVALKRYYLGRPNDAFQIMRAFGLGITNADLEKITIGLLPPAAIITPPPINPIATTTIDVLQSAAAAIRAKNKTLAASYFVPEMKKKVEYAVENMSNESLFILGNILSGAKLISSTADQKIYNNDVYFSLGGYEVPVKFYLKKQPDGSWLMTNL